MIALSRFLIYFFVRTKMIFKSSSHVHTSILIAILCTYLLKSFLIWHKSVFCKSKPYVKRCFIFCDPHQYFDWQWFRCIQNEVPTSNMRNSACASACITRIFPLIRPVGHSKCSVHVAEWDVRYSYTAI